MKISIATATVTAIFGCASAAPRHTRIVKRSLEGSMSMLMSMSTSFTSGLEVNPDASTNDDPVGSDDPTGDDPVDEVNPDASTNDDPVGSDDPTGDDPTGDDPTDTGADSMTSKAQSPATEVVLSGLASAAALAGAVALF